MADVKEDSYGSFSKPISKEKHTNSSSPPKAKVLKNGNNVMTSFLDKSAFQEVYKSFGTQEPELIEKIITQLSPLLFKDKTRERDTNALLAILHSFAPKDALEVLLASQMIASQDLAMKFLHLASLDEQTFEGRDAYINRATKLMRIFTQQMDALTRYRNRGQQHVTVQHVQVNGQAIVGTVNHNETGEGGNEKNRGSTPCKAKM